LGVSRTTVSDALRGQGRIGSKTVQRVRDAANLAGYRVNPLTSTVLGAIRRGRGPGLHGTIAVVDLRESTHWPHGPFPREIVTGVRERAAEMGFSIEVFTVGMPALSWPRLESILRARGIHGIVFLPAWSEPDLSALDWSRLTGIYTDYAIVRPGLNSICVDHYGSMLALLGRLRELGYVRPGLILQQGRDERIQHSHSAAFSAFHATHEGEVVPMLVTENAPRLAEDFAPWFRLHRPDVVLSHFSETIKWIEACRAARSGTGFVLLNLIECALPCAGFDLQPHILGRRAAELVVGQLLRNELGVPDWPSRTTIPARWVDGPTVRRLDG
jgi:LacI family transcriptional regulator